MAYGVTLSRTGRVVDTLGTGTISTGGFVIALAAATAIAILFFIVGAYFLTAIKLTTSVSKESLALFLSIAKWSSSSVGMGLGVGIMGYMIRLVALKCCSIPK